MTMRLRPLFRAARGFAASRLLGRHRPVAVGWDVTHRCNLRCRYCGFPALDPAELRPKEALDLCDAMAAAGAARVHLSGGEPMLRPDIGAIVRRLVRRGVEVALNSNGYQIAARLDELRGLGLLRLSYDGPEALHDALRGRGSHRVMREALHAARRRGLRVLLNATVNAQNAGQIEALIAESRRFRVPIKFQPIFPGLAYGRAIEETLPPEAAWRAALERIAAEKAQNPLIVNSPANLAYYRAQPSPPAVPCTAGLIYTRVDPLGRLYPCSQMMRPALIRDPRAPGATFLSAFRALPRVRCRRCLCPPTLELAQLYDLRLSSALNLPKYL